MSAEVKPTIIATLQATQLFAILDAVEIASFADRCLLRLFRAGEVLFSEGESCSGLYIVAWGRVRIFKTSANGREQVLSIEGPGGSIAELPVFDGGTYPASSAAIDDSMVLFVSRAEFRAYCLEHPEVALKVLQVVGVRLRRLVGIIEELSFTTLRSRLIAWLLREAQARGRKIEHGVVFDLGFTHQELASHIGTVRELVSRNMARLQAQGFIQVHGREITILDQDGLETELASPV